MEPGKLHRIQSVLRQNRALAIGTSLGAIGYVLMAIVAIIKLPAIGSVVVLTAAGGIGGAIAWLVIQEEFDRQQQRAQFRYALVQRIHAISHQPIDFGRFVAETGVSHRMAADVAQQIYREFFEGAVADGVLAQAEIASLDQIASALRIPRHSRAQIEAAAKESRYKQALQSALSDGVLSDAESVELQNLRRSLGMASQEIRRATGKTGEEAYRVAFNQVVAKGPITQADVFALAEARRALGLTDSDAFAAIRHDALALYRQRFYEAKQDGQITASEEQQLANLQQFLGLNPSDVARYQQEINRSSIPRIAD